MENINFIELTSTELIQIDGGFSWNWLNWVQPAYDFSHGIVQGFKSGLESDK